MILTIGEYLAGWATPWLLGVQKDTNSRSITYTRSGTGVTLSAVIATNVSDYDSLNDTQAKKIERPYIIRKADMDATANTAPPRHGDTITESSVTYSVMRVEVVGTLDTAYRITTRQLT